MTFFRSPPVRVVQQNSWWCWAACLEMLNTSQPAMFGTSRRNQSQWVDAMLSAPVASSALNAYQGLNMRFFPQFTNALGMQYRVWIPARQEPPDLSFVELKLRCSLLLTVITTPGGNAHFVIITGVDGRYVHYTDPAPGPALKIVPYALVVQQPLAIAWKP